MSKPGDNRYASLQTLPEDWKPKEVQKTFRKFSRLPAEIRVQIWVSTFRPAKISLSLHTTPFDEDDPWLNRSLYPVPETMSVNRESRAETLRHYTFIHVPRLLIQGGHQVPRCINPRVTTIILDHYTTLIHLTKHISWIKRINDTIHGGLRYIQEVEFEESFAPPGWDQWNWTEWERLGHLSVCQTRMCRFLLEFKGLKRVVLKREAVSIDPRHGVRIIRRYIEGLKQMLAAKSYEFNGGEIPEITFDYMSPALSAESPIH